MLNRSEEILQSIRGQKPTAEVLEFGESPERKAYLDAPVECDHGQVARREQRRYKAKVNAATYWLASWHSHLGEAEMSNDQAHIDLCQAKIKHYLAVLHDAEIYIKNCAEKRGEATVEVLPNKPKRVIDDGENTIPAGLPAVMVRAARYSAVGEEQSNPLSRNS